jgi:hypothetical protein
LVIFFFQISALKIEDRAELLQSGLELILGFLLGIAGILYTVYHDIPLVITHGLHGFVICRFASEQKADNARYNEPIYFAFKNGVFHQHILKRL